MILVLRHARTLSSTAVNVAGRRITMIGMQEMIIVGASSLFGDKRLLDGAVARGGNPRVLAVCRMDHIG